jgi:hypothetical protein
LGKAKVFMDIDAGIVRVTIPVDPDVLLMRLDALAGRPLDDPDSTVERDRRLRLAAPEFAAACSLAFDGRRSRPEIAYDPSAQDDARSSEGPPGFMRLSARMPDSATSVTWSYGLVYGAYPFVVRTADGSSTTEWIVGRATSGRIGVRTMATPSHASVGLEYFRLGFTHIVPKGVDHILFVLGIFFLSPRLRSLVLQVSCFTVAHSVTLGLTMYGLVSLPSSVVEPLIALSIAYVAVENLMTSELKRTRVWLVFAFGLLHGMGFAGVLGELGLPPSGFVTALVTFNLGVEAGQLAVIALAFASVGFPLRDRESYRRRIVWPASAAMAIVGLYWTVARLSS